MKIKEKVLKEIEEKHIGIEDIGEIYDYFLVEVGKIVDEFEKENTDVLKTKDIVKEKIIISDYIKWDKFRELKQKLGIK